MLIQYTPVSALKSDEKTRLRAAVTAGLMFTTEAARGYVMFEGKYFRVQEVQSLSSGTRQLLQEAP